MTQLKNPFHFYLEFINILNSSDQWPYIRMNDKTVSSLVKTVNPPNTESQAMTG